MAADLRILFLIRALDPAGAERQLAHLARGLGERGHHVCVAVFYGGGALEPELASAPNVRVVSLDKRGRWDLPGFMLRLAKLVRAERPYIVHGYLTVGNILAALAAPLAGAKTVMGLRSSRMDMARYDRASLWTSRVEAWLSRRARLAIANSQAGRDDAVERGFPAERLRVVPNGIDTACFQPAAPGSQELRRQWLGDAPGPLIGLAGRCDPKKDHETFLRAAALVARAEPGARFVCVGRCKPARQASLTALATELGLADRVVFAGPRADMPAVYGAWDLAVSSSAFGEGFPNVVGEAMACGVPCAVTDSGDAAAIVGDTGAVAPVRDPEALAQAILALLERSRREPDLGTLGTLGTRARQRIANEFSVSRLVERTEALLLEVRETAP